MGTKRTIGKKRLCMEKLESREVCSASPWGAALVAPPVERVAAGPAALVAPSSLQDASKMVAAAPAAPAATYSIVGTWRAVERHTSYPGWTVVRTMTFGANGYGSRVNALTIMGKTTTTIDYFKYKYFNIGGGRAELDVSDIRVSAYFRFLVTWHSRTSCTVSGSGGIPLNYYRQ